MTLSNLESQPHSVEESKSDELRVQEFRVVFDKDDPLDPQNFSTTYKIWLLVQMSLLTTTGALGSSIISPGSASISQYTGISLEASSLTVALFALGWTFGPMIWGPMSELYGRRLGMLPAVFSLGVLSIGTATSKSAPAILLTRFFGGVFACAPISNVPAALGDIFPPATRGNAMAFAAICMTGGPALGPVIGAALTVNKNLGWRWTEYVEAILALSLFGICTFCLPETYPPVILKRKAQNLRKETGDQRYWHPHEEEKLELRTAFNKHFSRPLRMLFTEPVVTMFAVYASFVYSLVYLILETFPIVFREKRHWGLFVSTLPFLSLLVFVACALLINFGHQKSYKRLVERNNGLAVPEARLPPMIIGGFLLSIGLFWFGWTAAPEYPWPSPVVAGGFVGAGINTVYQQCLNFLVDTYGPYGASATSANTMLRSVLACVMPIAARPLFENLGLGPGGSLLGGISCLALPVPFVFMKYGASLRSRSKFSSARDT